MLQLLNSLAVSFDLPILDWIAAHLHCPFLDTVMPWITKLGDAGIFWILCALVLLCIPRTRKMGVAMSIALVMGLVVCNMTIKPLVGRMRPYDFQALHFGREIPLLIPALSDPSFPSGHTIASFEGAVVIFLFNKKWGIPALLLAIAIAFSRLYLYVHYPTDVLTAVVLGSIFAFLACWITSSLYHRRHKGHFEA